MLLDIEEQEQIIWAKELDDYVRQVYFILDGLYVLAVTSGGKAYAFSRAGNNRLFSRQLHEGAVISSAVSQQHHALATGGEDGRFVLSDLHSGDILYAFNATGKWIEHVACSPDGKFFAFSCATKVMIVTADGQLYDTIQQSKNTISALAWHEDGNTLAIGFFGGVYLYSVDTMELYQFLPWKNAVVSLSISPDKRFVCSGTQDYQVHIWPLPYHPEGDLAMSGFPNKVKHLHWHHEGSTLATNSGKMVVVWDFSGIGPANKEPDMLKGHFLNVTALAFQHHNDLLVSGDEGGLLFFFCPKISSHSDYIVNIQDAITTLCWSPDDRFVLVGTAGGGLFMIDNPIETE
jgi:WD domain, G-beta repeat